MIKFHLVVSGSIYSPVSAELHWDSVFAEWAVNFRHKNRGRTNISNVDLSVTIVLFTTALSISTG